MIAALLTLFMALAVNTPGHAVEAPRVVASIKPVHSLVASIMEGVGEPVLLMDAAASPHSYALKPSQASALENADVVIWVGEILEGFLEKPLKSVASGATVIELLNAPGLVKQGYRRGDGFAPRDMEEGQGSHHDDDTHHDDDHAAETDEHGHHHHGHGNVDPHVWLDPENAKAMAAEITRVLVQRDPSNGERYLANLESLKTRIDLLSAEIARKLAPVGEKPFLVFHDAYRYFEIRYGLRASGTITVNPEIAPSAGKVRELRNLARSMGVACVFAEPQFAPRIVEVITEGTGARHATLDPLGANLEAGPGLYAGLLKNMADTFAACLGE